MDSVGLYRFDGRLGFECGLILGMPREFTPRYEISGIPVDPVLAEMRKSGMPSSTETLLGERWQASTLFRRVSGQFGLEGFAALPLYQPDRLAGVLYLGALTAANRKRLTHEGLCMMSVHATRLSAALMKMPPPHANLTPRQNEVARLAASGLSNRAIAEELDTGEASVRKHLKALNEIFGTTNRTAMAARWRAGCGEP
jgi:DNA-binding CsgD family transcriptional regulator